MRNILGHKSWNYEEVVAILQRTGTFCMCALPHYRYDRVKEVCRRLKRKGWIEKAGETDVGINWRVTPKFMYDLGLDLV